MESTVQRPRDAAATKEDLVAAARGVFAREGFEGATIREIGERAGANSAMVSYHFGSKQGLLSAVLLYEITAAEERIARQMTGAAGPSERLGAFLRGFADVAQDSPSFVPLLARELMGAGRNLEPEVEERFRGLFRPLQETLREGVEAGVFRVVDTYVTQISLVGGLVWFALTEPLREQIAAERRIPGPSPTWPGYAAHMHRLFERGLSNE